MRTRKMRHLKRDQVKDPSNSKGLLPEVQLVDLGLPQSVELEMEEKKQVVEVVEEVEVEVMEEVEEEEGPMRKTTKNKKRFVLVAFIPFWNAVFVKIRGCVCMQLPVCFPSFYFAQQ